MPVVLNTRPQPERGPSPVIAPGRRSGLNGLRPDLPGVTSTNQVSEVEGPLVVQTGDAICDLRPPGLLDDMFHRLYEQLLHCLARKRDDAWETPPQLSPTAHVEAPERYRNATASGSEPLLISSFGAGRANSPNHTGGDWRASRILNYHMADLGATTSCNLAHHLRQAGRSPTKVWSP